MWEDNHLVQKWEPVLEGIGDDYTRRVTAQLLENQAKSILSERMDEAAGSTGVGGMTTVGSLGTFQKFAFPLVRRVYPELIANNIAAVQPMQGPVSQIFYLGHTREKGGDNSVAQTVYSKFDLTYGPANLSGATTIESGGNLDGDAAMQKGFDVTTLLGEGKGVPSTTPGGKIASFPDTASILGYSVSAGEVLQGDDIPDISFHIEQQAVVARTRKMKALWTMEAQQDLKAYHDLDLERELTGLLSKEIALEIDREIIEDIRMIAYDVNTSLPSWTRGTLDNQNPNSFGATGGKGPFDTTGFSPGSFTYDFDSHGGGQDGEMSADPAGAAGNIWIIDYAATAVDFAPQHMGHVYANLLALLNLASQDIYKTTMRGPGSWLLTSPLIGAMLESAAKLEGGVEAGGSPTNMGSNKVQYKGKFAGKYDLYIDPLYPEDEILMGYKGTNAMDAGYVYAPYIPLQQLPTITDPQTFQPRKGILTRYGKAGVEPMSRFYRVIRIVGPTANYLLSPFAKNATNVF